jgi:hypothetical protein
MRTRTASARLRWIALGAPVVFLTAFHGALLVRHFADASIARPMVLGRWAFTAVLLAAALIARKFLTGRRVALIFWLLVAVLHLAIPAGGSVNNAALLVAVLPALIVLGATAGNLRNAPWPASMLLHRASIGFVPLRLDPFHAGRAPPRF